MNIIGICGRKNSGKSTIARMIAELVPGTVEVQLAAPMKKFCADVFGWSDATLNGPSEMRETPDERYMRGRVCPCCKGSGQTSDLDLCCAGCDGTGMLGRTLANQVPEDDVKYKPIYLTPRYALQRLGTEFGRHCYEDVWIDYALCRAERRLAEKLTKMCENCGSGWLGPQAAQCADCRAAGVETVSKYRVVVIPDVRFINEARRIREVGGQVWRVRRPHGMICDTHASESEQFSDEMSKYVNHDIENLPTMNLTALRELVRGLIELREWT